MPDFSFVLVAVIAFMAPVLRELISKLFVPAIVLELVLGIIVGPRSACSSTSWCRRPPPRWSAPA